MMMFQKLFHSLKTANYYWQPKTPDQLLVARKSPEKFMRLRPLEKYFGLGLPVARDVLLTDGLDPEIALTLTKTPDFAVSCDRDGQYIVHDHWPPKKGGEYVHFGIESFHVARQIANTTAKVSAALDLGCSSGVLSFELSKKSNFVLGLDSCARAIDFARKTKEARGLSQCEFKHFKIEKKNLSAFQQKFDIIVFNPPLGIPEKSNFKPHRDGGHLGIEIPLMFLDFAYLHAAKGAQCFFIAGDPVIKGVKAFNKAIENKGRWNIDAREVIEPYFNQSVAKIHEYAWFDIDRIELVLYGLSLCSN